MLIPVGALVGSFAVLVLSAALGSNLSPSTPSSCPPGTGRSGNGTFDYFGETGRGEDAYAAVLGIVNGALPQGPGPGVEVRVERIPNPLRDTGQEFWLAAPLAEPVQEGDVLYFRFTVEPSEFKVGWVSLIPAEKGGYVVESVGDCWDAGTLTTD